MDFAAFHAFHAPPLEADEARHYMLLSALADLATYRRQDFRGWTFSGAGACAIQPTSDYAIMLGELSSGECRMLAEELARDPIPGVMGPDDGPDRFVAAAQGLGMRFEPPLRNRIHCLEELPQPLGVEGEARPVTQADAALFVEWMRAYMRQALPRDPMPDSAWMERWSVDSRYLFWTVRGEPVAVAGIVAETRTGAAVTGVYTREDMRGRGYASAVTAAAARAILEDGRSRVFLMANTGNAPALRAYARIGFRQVAGFTHYWRLYS
jgi:RimJ/RimL family protein N-acetyltransferase